MAENGTTRGSARRRCGLGAHAGRGGGDVAGALNPCRATGMGRTTGSTPGIRSTSGPRCRRCGMFSDVYHRAEVRGLDNIPAEGPGAARGQPLRRHADRGHVRVRAGVLRPLRAAAPLPPARPRPGLPAPGRARRACRATGPCRHRRRTWRARSSATPRCSCTPAATTRRTGPSWESAEIDFAGRTGFVRLAIEHDVPIVPVVAIGGQETALFLGRAAGSPSCCGSTACCG